MNIVSMTFIFMILLFSPFYVWAQDSTDVEENGDVEWKWEWDE